MDALSNIKRVPKLDTQMYVLFWARCTSMIMNWHGSLGFGRGLPLGACWVRTQLFAAGMGSAREREREAVGENVQELTHHHHPPRHHGVEAQFWLKCLKYLDGASLKETMLKGHILCCNWQSAYFNSTPFQREAKSQISLIEILIEHSWQLLIPGSGEQYPFMRNYFNLNENLFFNKIAALLNEKLSNYWSIFMVSVHCC